MTNNNPLPSEVIEGWVKANSSGISFPHGNLSTCVKGIGLYLDQLARLNPDLKLPTFTEGDMNVTPKEL